jgi:hypothetical protein
MLSIVRKYCTYSGQYLYLLIVLQGTARLHHSFVKEPKFQVLELIIYRKAV